MTPAQLADAVRAAGAAALSGLGLDPSVLPHAVSVERPRNPEHGDYASALALQVAGQAGVPPRELAQEIAAKLGEDPEIQSVEIAGPGFLNIRLSSAASGAVAGIVVEQGDAYGHAQALTGQRVNLEFVSANPTGPIHIGGARWAAVGEIRASLAGFGVHFGVYFNEKDLHDAGGSTRPWPRSGNRATSTRRTARPGSAPRTSATTKTASTSAAAASSPTSAPTAPTTWTSANEVSARSS
jgi:arginyl-tRNA synthetase